MSVVTYVVKNGVPEPLLVIVSEVGKDEGRVQSVRCIVDAPLQHPHDIRRRADSWPIEELGVEAKNRTS